MRTLSAVLLAIVSTTNCTATVAHESHSLEGDWEITWSASKLPSCISIMNGIVTAVYAECARLQPIVAATPASVQGDAVFFAYTLGAMDQASAEPIAVELTYIYSGHFQDDGSIIANREITSKVNGIEQNLGTNLVTISRP